MDHIHALLLMEDELDDEPPSEVASSMECHEDGVAASSSEPGPSIAPVVDWCVCRHCRPMPQEVENKCCKLRTCITTTARFEKLCLDQDVLQLCVRNMGEVRNDRDDNSTRSFRKAAYRQFILARHGHLGKGNRRVCPSCVVMKIRQHYPSQTGVYMGYREN